MVDQGLVRSLRCSSRYGVPFKMSEVASDGPIQAFTDHVFIQTPWSRSSIYHVRLKMHVLEPGSAEAMTPEFQA